MLRPSPSWRARRLGEKSAVRCRLPSSARHGRPRLPWKLSPVMARQANGAGGAVPAWSRLRSPSTCETAEWPIAMICCHGDGAGRQTIRAWPSPPTACQARRVSAGRVNGSAAIQLVWSPVSAKPSSASGQSVMMSELVIPVRAEGGPAQARAKEKTCWSDRGACRRFRPCSVGRVPCS